MLQVQHYQVSLEIVAHFIESVKIHYAKSKQRPRLIWKRWLAFSPCFLAHMSYYAFKRRFYILLTSYRHQVLMKNYYYYSQYGQFNMRSFVTHLSLVLSFDLFLTDFYRWNVACVFDKSSMLRCIAMITCTCKIVRRSYAIF